MNLFNQAANNLRDKSNVDLLQRIKDADQTMLFQLTSVSTPSGSWPPETIKDWNAFFRANAGCGTQGYSLDTLPSQNSETIVAPTAHNSDTFTTTFP